MIQKIEIENFKNFERFEFDGFRRVNLIAGKNNVGKTNLLEGIYLGFTGYFPMGIIGLHANRHKVGISTFFSKPLTESGASSEFFVEAIQKLFNGSSQFISVRFDGGRNFRLEKRNFEAVPKFDGVKQEVDIRLLEAKDYDSTLPNQAFASLEISPGLGTPLVRFINYLGFPFNPVIIRPSNPKCAFLQPNSYGISEYERQYDKVFETGQLKKFQEILSLFIGEEIVDTQLVDRSGDGYRVLYLQKKGGNKPVGFGELGFGVNRLVPMLLSLFQAENGVAFLDEVDLGIHHTRQELLWEKLFQLAQELNVQLFATTHSKDCFEAFAAVSNTFKGEGKFIRLQEFKGKIEAVEYDEQSMEVSAESGYEVR